MPPSGGSVPDIHISIELAQLCSDDCRPDAHAVTVFTELGVSREDLISLCSEYGEVIDAKELPEAVCDWDDEVPDGWRVWYRMDPAKHLAAQR